jgi:hypothetical protein
MTDCKQEQLILPEINIRPIVADFGAGHITSDGGSVLLGQLETRFGYLSRFEKCFKDYRDPVFIEHALSELLRQRIFGIALGYEDLNDHDLLRKDPLLAAVCGKKDVLGENRKREEDRGNALAGKSTLNRMELTKADASRDERYKKIAGDETAIENYFIEEWVNSLPENSREVILDPDATDDIIHGNQEGRFFHGYYGNYCYLPLYIFCGNWPIVAKLRTSDIDGSAGTLEEIQKIIQRLRMRFPDIRIIIRADSGFCRDALLSWCEQNQVYYVIGLARNSILETNLSHAMGEARKLSEANEGKPARVFTEFQYAAKTWENGLRRVIGKAEWTQGEANPRFIITNLPEDKYPGQSLYEKMYCARGNMENRIKEQQLDLFADRTSTAFMRSNQLRLWFSTLAYLLMNKLREAALTGTEMARSTCGTIRLRLFKIGALVTVSCRRIALSMSSAFPLQQIFKTIMNKLLIT